jgi:hypothetical protein
MRLDHILLSTEMCERLVDGGVDRRALGAENATHHALAWACFDHRYWTPQR